MRRDRHTKAVEDALAQHAAEVNAADRPGIAPEDRPQAVAADNERVLNWLTEKQNQHDPQAWVWEPPARDRLVMVIITTFERYYREKKNPTFAWCARRLAREFVPHLANDPALRWIDDYLDTAARGIAELVDHPPPTDMNDRIAAALGFEVAVGRGRRSAISKAQLLIRDGNLAAAVVARLPLERGKEGSAIAHVAAQYGLSSTTVGDAFRSFKADQK
jgi:hypothetical protein